MSNYRFIASCDNNDTYTGFIPSWIDHHKKLYPKSDIKIILVSDEFPYTLNNYIDDIILFKPLENMHTAYQAQMIRLVYPVLLSDKKNIICDIDMYILNPEILDQFDKVYVDRFNNGYNSVYINYGCLDYLSCMKERQLPLFFSVYDKKILHDVFKVKNMDDIKEVLIENYEKKQDTYGYDWFTDQRYLYKLFFNSGIMHKIERFGGDRIDRNWFNPSDPNIIRKIKTNSLIDFHAPRPYQKYKSFIRSVLQHVNY